MSKNGNGSSKNGATPSSAWAGSGRRGDGKIRVAIVGVGNCASSLVQGRYYYENANADDFIPGLMHVDLAPLPRLLRPGRRAPHRSASVPQP